MSEVMKKLHKDHANISRLMNVLREQVTLLADGDPDWSLICDIIDYVEQYPDKYHHPLEDQLFRIFLKVTDDRTAKNAIGTLISEHVEMANQTQKLRQLVADLQINSVMLPREEISQMLEDYIAFQRQHLVNEESEIFPMIEQQMTDREWAQLDKSIVDAGDPLFEFPDKKHFKRLFESIVTAESC